MKPACERIVVLGATSGIATEVVRLAASEKKELLLVGRNKAHLDALASDALIRGAKTAHVLSTDFLDSGGHARLLEQVSLIWDRIDVVFLAYGTMLEQEKTASSTEMTMAELNANFVSPASLLTLFANALEKQQSGCIAVITSVAGDRGRQSNYIYGSAKGGLSLFLQGLRNRLSKNNVRVLTIKPGPVKTRMTEKMKQGFLFSEPGDVANPIWREISKGSKDVLYVPLYWRYVMLLIRNVPERIAKRLQW